MRSIATHLSGLINTSSDSGEEFVVQKPQAEPIDSRFRIGGRITDPMTAFVMRTLQDCSQLVSPYQEKVPSAM